jgi:RsiW-degrading membrane proteinase PrsW (M82 family)
MAELITNILLTIQSFAFAGYAGIANAISNSPTFVLQTFVYALIGGLFPALIWLWFWMHENHEHHEPKYTLWLTFICGMCAVFLVYPFQKLIAWIVGEPTGTWTIILLWAALEELFKFLAAYFIALRDKIEIFDEPIDAFVYLMTASLGFAALENTLFLITPLLQGNTLSSIIVGNMRFMGANLLHVAASGLLSICIAFAYYKSVWTQRLYTIIGLLIAFVFHAGFNYALTLIENGILGKEKIFLAFSFVWITLIILILALEKVKKLKEF